MTEITRCPSPERAMAVQSGAGLCNRLRVLFSGMVIAEQTHRSFTAHWSPTHPCSCAWGDLFTNPWNVRAAPLPDKETTHDLGFCRWKNIPDLLSAREPYLGVRHHSWLLFPDRFPHHAPYLQQCAGLFAQLEPVPEIAARIETFRETYFRVPVIGVHLRRGDMIWLSPDTTNNTGPAMLAVDAFLRDTPEALIFLCSDDGALNPISHASTPYEGLREKFVRRFGARVIWTQPRTLDRRAPGAIQDALVDLYLLRQADYFVGTARSSFSELAVFGRTVSYVLTKQSQPYYEKTERRLRRWHLDGLVKRLSMADAGEPEPLPMLYYKYTRRALRYVKRWVGKS